MKNIFRIFVCISFFSASYSGAQGLTPHSSDRLCSDSQEKMANLTDQYIENFKSCYALVKAHRQNSQDYKDLVNSANQYRLSIHGELYNCGYYCDDPTPCNRQSDIMLNKNIGGDQATVACWGDAW